MFELVLFCNWTPPMFGLVLLCDWTPPMSVGSPFVIKHHLCFELVYVGIGEGPRAGMFRIFRPLDWEGDGRLSCLIGCVNLWAIICRYPYRFNGEYICEGVLCGWFKEKEKSSLWLLIAHFPCRLRFFTLNRRYLRCRPSGWDNFGCWIVLELALFD